MPLAVAPPYTLQLPDWAGPLDVLLRLIEKAELEITTISLAQVAEQYLAHVRALPDPAPLTVAEFLALAAQLLLLKSRALLLRQWEAEGRRTWELLAPPPMPNIAPPALLPHEVSGLVKALERRLRLLAPQTVQHHQRSNCKNHHNRRRCRAISHALAHPVPHFI